VAFLASGAQGVSYHRGTWHHPLVALGERSDFLVVDRGGSGDNLVEFMFEQEIEIAAE
jgi:ureidoglycolate lyase